MLDIFISFCGLVAYGNTNKGRRLWRSDSWGIPFDSMVGWGKQSGKETLELRGRPNPHGALNVLDTVCGHILHPASTFRPLDSIVAEPQNMTRKK
jgi:hypothetical protein